MYRCIVISALIAILGILSISAEAAPSTRLAITPRPITDLSVNGSRIAWVSMWDTEYGDGSYGEVWAQDLRTNHRVRFDRGGEQFWSMELLAFAGGRVVWRETYEDVHSDHEAYLSTATIANPRVRSLRDLYAAWFLWLADADRAPLVFAPIEVGITNWDKCEYDGGDEPPAEDCHYAPFGSLSRMEGQRERRLRAVPLPAMFSAHRGRVAIVPADRSGMTTGGNLIRTPTVEVRRLADGTLVHRFELDGLPLALTLSRSLLTVLVQGTDDGRRLERYRPSGAFLGSTLVSGRTRPRLDTDGHWVVFSAGKYIRALDGRNGAVAILRRLPKAPIDLQASGGRAVWGVNWGSRGYVRSAPLPTG